MSASQVQRVVERIQSEIESLQRQQIAESQRDAAKLDALSRANEALSRATTASTRQTKQSEVLRLDRDRVAIQKRRADIDKRIGQKTQELHRKQKEVFSAQQREQKDAIDGLRARDSKFRAEQNAKFRLLASPAAVPSHEGAFVVRNSTHDAFISHASEDKDDLVRPLAEHLIGMGFAVWYDEFQLTVGDSLRRSIDRGLAGSRFGIVVLSPSFFAKNWPQYELDGLVAKESLGGKVILPLWHKVSKDEVISYSPTLADKLALSTAVYSVAELAEQLAKVLRAEA